MKLQNTQVGKSLVRLKGITTPSVKRQRQWQGSIGIHLPLALMLQNRPPPPFSKRHGGASHMSHIHNGFNLPLPLDARCGYSLKVLGVVVRYFILKANDIKTRKQIVYVFLGNEDANQVLVMFLSTASFVGGVLGFLLDNILPGKLSLHVD